MIASPTSQLLSVSFGTNFGTSVLEIWTTFSNIRLSHKQILENCLTTPFIVDLCFSNVCPNMCMYLMTCAFYLEHVCCIVKTLDQVVTWKAKFY